MRDNNRVLLDIESEASILFLTLFTSMQDISNVAAVFSQTNRFFNDVLLFIKEDVHVHYGEAAPSCKIGVTTYVRL